MSKRWFMWIGCGVMMVGGAFVLWNRGYTNVLSYAILLLCPLLHLVMHRGHGHDHGPGSGTNQANHDTKENKPACH